MAAVGVVLDNGACTMKAGFSGAAEPRAVFPPVVRRMRHSPAAAAVLKSAQDAGRAGMLQKDAYVGDECQVPRTCSASNPVRDRAVTNWVDMEKVWHHTFFNELRVDPEEHPVLLTDFPTWSTAARERMVQVMFEVFRVHSLYVADPPALAMAASGKHTGLWVSSGLEVTDVVPVYQGCVLPHAQQRTHVGGQHVTDHLMRTLTAHGHSFVTTHDTFVVNDMKERLCYVAPCPGAAEPVAAGARTYELPDGSEVTLDRERHTCTEALFRPELVGVRVEKGVHELVHTAAMQCDGDVRKELLSHTLLSGGTTLFPGFGERLRQEVTQAGAWGADVVTVVAPPLRKYSVWIGGSVFAQAREEDGNTFIQRDEYDASGPAIVHRKRG